MDNATSFHYQTDPLWPDASLPYLPLTLSHQGRTVNTQGLVDSGSTVNVMPFGVGAQLGAVWDQEGTTLVLAGNLANFEARPLIVTARVAHFLPVRLAFAWTKSEEVPLILGQVNFFLQFDVCLFRAQSRFDVSPKSRRSNP